MKSSLYTRFSDAFSDLSLDENTPKPVVTFKEQIKTNLVIGLVEEINFEEELLGCYVLSYEFGEDRESHFLTVLPNGQGAFYVAGGAGDLDDAFAIFENIEGVKKAIENIPPVNDTRTYTVYKILYEKLTQAQNDNTVLLFDAVLRENLRK